MPTDKEIEIAEKKGFLDGLNGNEMSSRYKYRDVLNATYITAKWLGRKERIRLKDLKIYQKFNRNKMNVEFLNAVVAGDLGEQSNGGVIVSTQEFKAFFKNVRKEYASSFLSSITSHSCCSDYCKEKYVFRVQRGVYLVHPGAINDHIEIMLNEGELRSEIIDSTTS